MKEKEFICIVCPKGCKIRVLVKGSKIISVKGKKCPKGIEYTKNEATNPKRNVFTTVKIKNGIVPMLPVKTKKQVPKEMVIDVMRYLSTVSVTAPITIGDIIVENILNTGIDVIATRSVGVKNE